MIYTLTMNAAIDLFIETNKVEYDSVNRSNYDELQPNGKGINVSFIMKQLNIDTTALGYVGGFTGDYIINELNKKNIGTNFVSVDGNTRINVFTRVLSKKDEFKLVNKGPNINYQQKNKLLDIIKNLKNSDMLIISGSLPRGIEPKFLIDIIKILSENKVQFILDTSYEIVMDLLEFEPLMLKPNIEELQIWTKTKVNSTESMLAVCKDLIKKGAKSVLLSLGSDGAMYVNDNSAFKVNAPQGNVVNTACSGDTLLGSFVAKRLNGELVEDALAFAVAAGSSTAFSPGLTDFIDVPELLKQIKIEKIVEE
ncbi:1-phosphofructokinase [Ruoffia sp. FAM 24228]|uniref:1-phosphofructokinase n=2 Tax=Bacillota TaxID=1239 RepID=UPI0038863C74